MAKLNCWEYKKCGREPGGVKINELGVCVAATEERLDGFNGGKNAGRLCWAVAGTLCSVDITGSFAKKLQSCISCDFLKLVTKEERIDK